MQGIGNGLPLAAVVTTPEIAATLAQRLHFNTYGGNPVCCAGGRAVLQAVDEDGIQANAAKVGSNEAACTVHVHIFEGQGSCEQVLLIANNVRYLVGACFSLCSVPPRTGGPKGRVKALRCLVYQQAVLPAIISNLHSQKLCSLQVGNLLLERMRGLQEKHSIIGDVRGQGLMLGMEMIKDRTSKEPAAAETAQVWHCSGVKFLGRVHTGRNLLRRSLCHISFARGTSP